MKNNQNQSGGHNYINLELSPTSSEFMFGGFIDATFFDDNMKMCVAAIIILIIFRCWKK